MSIDDLQTALATARSFARSMPKTSLLLTCEHAGNRVPDEYSRLFQSKAAIRALRSHRGYDIGAHEFAKSLAKRLRASLLVTDITRLLVDANRSATHPRVCSEFADSLSNNQRRALIAKHWAPHRNRVESRLRHITSQGFALHVAVHSFTPRLAGDVRNADIGLLYDPNYGREKRWATRWRALLREAFPKLRIRRNYPYRGTSDGLTTYLRGYLPASRYAGIELELNQRFFIGNARRAPVLLVGIANSLLQLTRELE